jgi:uncharacterized membrane protein
MKRVLFKSGGFFLLTGIITAKADDDIVSFLHQNTNMISLFEIVVAGIVASAIVIAIIVLFIGQWSGKKQAASIKRIRHTIEKDEKIIKASLANVDKNTAKIQQLLNTIEKKSSAITSKQHQAWIHAEDLEEMLEDATEYTSELQQTTESVNQRITQVQHYWDQQLNDTAGVVERVQSTLKDGLKQVESGLHELQKNEKQSRTISQKIVKTYHQQSIALSENASTSHEIKKNLKKAFAESTQLLQQLDEHKHVAKKSFQKFNDELTTCETQANEKFNDVFQATDRAKQELTANINESRQHIDNLRRYESEGRTIKLQTHNHLEIMSNKSMEQFTTTLENTQQIFATLQNDVQDAQYTIDTLQKIKQQALEAIIENDPLVPKTLEETKIDQKTNEMLENKEVNGKTEYQAVSGDSTLVPFFSFLKKQKK